jgi:hypothetical protein
MKQVFTALLVFLTVLPASARADKCQDMLLEIGDFLAAKRNVCKTDDGCGGYYFNPAPCERAVILPKAVVTNSFTLELVKLQDTARTACREKWQDAPACSSVPAKPVCREGACVDEMQDKKPE